MATKKPKKTKLIRIGEVRPSIDTETEKMLDKLTSHYDRTPSDTVRQLIKNDYLRLFGGGKI